MKNLFEGQSRFKAQKEAQKYAFDADNTDQYKSIKNRISQLKDFKAEMRYSGHFKKEKKYKQKLAKKDDQIESLKQQIRSIIELSIN